MRGEVLVRGHIVGQLCIIAWSPIEGKRSMHVQCVQYNFFFLLIYFILVEVYESWNSQIWHTCANVYYTCSQNHSVVLWLVLWLCMLEVFIVRLANIWKKSKF